MRVVLDDGTSIDLGETDATPTIGISDFSRRETDDFGVTTVVPRGFARRMSVKLIVPFDQVDDLQRQLAALRATPARWVADDRYSWLDFRGFYKDFSIDLNVPPISYCTLTVEGLTATEDFTDPGTDPAPGGEASKLMVLQPVVLGTDNLLATSVPENDHPEWVASTTYPVGARVVKAATHRIYENGAAGNLGNDPSGASGKWTDIGPTNRWAMFDQALGSETSSAAAITLTVGVGVVDALVLLNVTAATVRVQTDGFDRTAVPNLDGTASFLDLPVASAAITVTISGSGTKSVGTLLVGKLMGLGHTESSPSASITDFSKKETDDFGEVTVVERSWAKRMSVKAVLRTDAIDLVANRIAAVRGRPALWIGADGIEALTIYGFFSDFSIAVDTMISRLSLTVEGLSTAGKVEPFTPSVAWPDVTDPLATKPEDNATYGAPGDSPVGSLTGDQVVTQLQSQEAALALLDSDTAQALIDIAAAQGTISQIQSDAVQARQDIIAAGGRIDTLETTLGTQGATISQLQQTVSNQAGALATLTTRLSAVTVSINENANFSDWPDGQQLPTNWASSGSLGGIERVPGIDGQWAVKQYGNAAGRTAMLETVPNVSAGDYVLDVTVVLRSGGDNSLASSAVLVEAGDGSSIVETHAFLLDDEVGSATVDRVYRLSFPITFTNPAIKSCNVFLFTRAEFAPFQTFGIVEWHSAELRGGAEAKNSAIAIQQAEALATLDLQYATISSTVTTQGSSVSANAQAISSLQGNVATLSFQVATTTRTVNPNPVFSDWPDAGAPPANWSISGAAGNLTRVPGIDGAWAVRQEGYAAGRTGFVERANFTNSGNYAADITYVLREGGDNTLASSCVYFEGVDEGGSPTEAHIYWLYDDVGSGTLNYFYRRSFAFSHTNPNTRHTNVYVFTRAEFAGIQAFGVVDWHKVALRSGAEADNSASISVQAQALSSLSTSFATLDSTVTAQGATVSQQQTAIAQLNNGQTTLFARAATRLDVNGYVTGWETNNNGQSGDFTINADFFRILKPGGGPRTEYSGGHWRVYNGAGNIVVRMGVW